ncbi:MFS general substrate transporter [Serendipita vermifera]|nr:MFS general substrate transporter [Serendipita vermifera]
MQAITRSFINPVSKPVEAHLAPMSAPSTGLYGAQNVVDADNGQTKSSLSGKTSDRVHEIPISSSSQPNARDKNPSSSSIPSPQLRQQTLSDLASIPSNVGATPAITPETRKHEKWVLAAMFVSLFLIGWNDGTLGPLLPRIQEWYGVNFTVVSMVFVSACVGCLAGSVSNVWLSDKFNFGTIIVAASLCQVIAFSVLTAAPPFPVFCILFAFNGAGIAIQDAQANGLVASIRENGSEKMGVLHAVYGLGAFASPLVSTQFAQLPRWSFHFLTSLGLAVVNTSFLFWTVGGQPIETVLTSIGSPPLEINPSAPMELTTVKSSTSAMNNPSLEGEGHLNTAPQSSISQILRNRVVQLMAFFILVYVGVEVTIGGWIVSYMINVRGGGPSSGYVSSGFFGGLTLGRVVLLWVNKKVGERRVVFIYAALAIALELVVWLVPSFVGNAVAVSLVGVLLGPMYPLCMNHAGRVLPRKILTGSIGWVAAFGAAGSAVLPFMTGALANRFGLKSLQPLLVSMMTVMAVLWALIPGHSKRTE